MKKIGKIFIIILSSYLIYAFCFSFLAFAILEPADNKNEQDNIEDKFEPGCISQDRAEQIESGVYGVSTRLNLIESAAESIDMAYYSLGEGETTELILGSMIKAADRGVKIRILVDGMFPGIGGKLKNTKYGLAVHPNIEFKLYQPLNILLPWTWNNRLHDKIILVDGKLALIGGRNLGDRFYLEDIQSFFYTKDRDALIYNPEIDVDGYSVLHKMNDYFTMMWNHKYCKPSIKKLKAKEATKGEAMNRTLKDSYMDSRSEYLEDDDEVDWLQRTMSVDRIKFVYNPIGRFNKEPVCLKELLTLTSQADKSVMQSPYIVPSRFMKADFRDFDIDMSRVTLLTNSLATSSNIMGAAAYTNNKERIVRCGANLYEYQGLGSLHSKTYIFDRSISVVGSFNLDARSSYINTESMVVIYGKKFAKELSDTVQIDIDKSLRVDENTEYIEDENVEEKNIHKTMAGFVRIFSKLSLFLEHLV